MNFLKQIEAALKAINQARFQDLINHLLHNQGYTFIGAPGSVVAKEKTSKGAPDSFFVDGNKYVFVECTTLERLGTAKSFLEKLKNDIEHCFDENKTGINKSDIDKIILACTDKISPDEYRELKSKVNNYNLDTTLIIFSIQNLPMRILDFPGLSEQYLGVEIIKGEIYTLPDFLLKTTKGLQPSLTNDFVGREEELKQASDALKNVNILLLSGNAGVGKSKLATIILKEIEKEGFIPIVIQSSAAPLWNDFTHLFQNGKDYIILFDDANKSVQNLSYLLDFVQKPKTYKLKVVITCRDYVKQQVTKQLDNSKYKEIIVEKLKDKKIEEIVLKALPNLQYYRDIKRKIIELAKGNPRVALMATYSITPDAEANYLDSPVLLYEKYFKKISEEIEAFSNIITLQALAIVSFFGVLDRNNAYIKEVLEKEFNTDWDELWVAILDLHRNEVLDMYANEVVKVSDQVLASFAFYKCFIDSTSTVINYAQWILIFIEKYPSRIKNTLVDANNTFTYDHIKELVSPHLDRVISNKNDDEFLYTFYSIFWFYKKYDTLIYLKEWINQIESETQPKVIPFTYVHNNHTTPTRYFDLLINFWYHSDELLKPSIQLGIELVSKQASRIPEFLKFVDDRFTITLDDREDGYTRQSLLLDILLSETRSDFHKQLATGTFVNISEKLLGWHFHETILKGREFTIYNFDLYNCPELLDLRKKILEGFYILFTENNEQTNKILTKIINPGGKIDKEIYTAELPIYKKIIANRLSFNQYSHCKFVKELAKKIGFANNEIPDEWKEFIDSEILRLSKFLRTDFEDRKGKTGEEREEEKRKEIQKHILSKEWEEIEALLLSIDNLYKQQSIDSRWSIDYGITEVFIAIAGKGKSDIEKALRIFFNGKISFSLQTRVIYFILYKNILSGKELFEIMNDYEFNGKTFWITTLLHALPENQVDFEFVEILIQTFENSIEQLPINRMIDFTKYEKAFGDYKTINSEKKLDQHNIISYLTAILLSQKDNHQINLGFHFCQECAQYFSHHIHLLKQSFFYLQQHDNHFDYDGKEFEAVLNLDNNFLIDYLEQKTLDHSYLSIRFENFKLESVWALPNYEEIVSKSIEIILQKSRFSSNQEDLAAVLFTFQNADENLITKINNYLGRFINKHYLDEQRIEIIMNIIFRRFHDRFISYLKQFLFLNKDVEFFRAISLNTGGSISGSRVPYIQREIEFVSEIIIMIKTLPDILDYAKHLNYLEQTIIWLRKDIDNEQRRDFEDYLS